MVDIPRPPNVFKNWRVSSHAAINSQLDVTQSAPIFIIPRTVYVLRPFNRFRTWLIDRTVAVNAQFFTAHPTPIPPLPPHPIGPVLPRGLRVIPLDNVFGSDLITRNSIIYPRVQVRKGEAVAMVFSVNFLVPDGQEFSATFTRPDGTMFTLSPPYVAVDPKDLSTVVGRYIQRSDVTCVVVSGRLNQTGRWSVVATSGAFTSSTAHFLVRNW